MLDQPYRRAKSSGPHLGEIGEPIREIEVPEPVPIPVPRPEPKPETVPA